MRSEGEAQYTAQIDQMRKDGVPSLGFMSGHTYVNDPKRLLFLLSRYKFVSRMFSGLNHVLEVGCGDGFGTRLVAQSVGRVTGLDFDPDLLESANKNNRDPFKSDFVKHDIIKNPYFLSFDGVYCLDVLEHIPLDQEGIFIKNIIRSARDTASFIFGCPSLESQEYASLASKLGHVNCKTEDQLRETMSNFFNNVFLFGMNDEVAHTGFGKMAHYRLALCCNPKSL